MWVAHPAIRIHPDDPARSPVVGTDRVSGLATPGPRRHPAPIPGAGRTSTTTGVDRPAALGLSSKPHGHSHVHATPAPADRENVTRARLRTTPRPPREPVGIAARCETSIRATARGAYRVGSHPRTTRRADDGRRTSGWPGDHGGVACRTPSPDRLCELADLLGVAPHKLTTIGSDDARLAELRVWRGRASGRLAEGVGMPASTLSAIESARCPLHGHQAAALVATLGARAVRVRWPGHRTAPGRRAGR